MPFFARRKQYFVERGLQLRFARAAFCSLGVEALRRLRRHSPDSVQIYLPVQNDVALHVG